MDSYEFFIKCEPPKTTAQAGLRILKGKNGKSFIGKMSSSKANCVKNNLSELLKPFVPKEKFDGALRLEIHWIYPYKKTEKKKNIGKKIWCITRPDCDNLNKMFADLMTKLEFFYDDSQVCDLNFKKFYHKDCGIRVKIEKMNIIGD